MKFANAAALLFLLATPALADATKTTGGVLVECTVTGSSKDGFDVTADNKNGTADRDCTATCKLTKKDGSTLEKSYSKKAGKNLKVWMGGDAGVSGAPLSSPNLSSASCS